MKARTFLGMVMMLMALVSMTARGNENDGKLNSNDTNPTESLYGEWRLVGWNDGGEWFEVDTNFVSHRHLSIEIPEEGYVMAYSIVNEIVVGLLTLNGNEMAFVDGGAKTKVGCSREENRFFEDYICNIKSYMLEEKQLRLYYTDDDYFVFTSDFDDSEEHFYEWKYGPTDPYIGEVTAMDDGEVEVKIIDGPSYAIFYSRTVPPTGNNEICRFAASDLSDQSFEVGDKIAFRIVQFKRLKVEKGREYQTKVESYKGSEHIADKTGTMHNDQRMGWIIIGDEVREGKWGTYYYPLKNLAEVFLTEGLPVKFSGELYPTWMMPWDSQGESDNYYLSVDAIEGLHDVAAVRSITTTTIEKSSPFYNLQGQRLNSAPQKGIYIQNGKKVVMK